MDDLDWYPIDQMQDMELEDWETDGRSDSERIGDLAAIRALKGFCADPHLDRDERDVLEKFKRRGLTLDPDPDDEEFDVD